MQTSHRLVVSKICAQYYKNNQYMTIKQVIEIADLLSLLNHKNINITLHWKLHLSNLKDDIELLKEVAHQGHMAPKVCQQTKRKCLVLLEVMSVKLRKESLKPLKMIKARKSESLFVLRYHMQSKKLKDWLKKLYQRNQIKSTWVGRSVLSDNHLDIYFVWKCWLISRKWKKEKEIKRNEADWWCWRKIHESDIPSIINFNRYNKDGSDY